MRTITLELDEDDWNTIQSELARQQTFRDSNGPVLPDGDSNMVGAMVAEAIRNLEEYRSIWEAEHPRGGTPWQDRMVYRARSLTVEHIDVTFGGRSVRLKPTKVQGPRISLWAHESLVVGALQGKWFAAHKWIPGDIPGDTPQEAVAAVESKLRDLRDQLTSILGDAK